MPITIHEVEHVAWLARMALTEDEKRRLAHELNRILDAFRELQKLDTEGVEPTSHAVPMFNVLRDDEVTGSTDRDAILSNAPDRRDEFFGVPRVVE